MDDIGMTVHTPNPFVGPQTVHQEEPHWQKGEETFYHPGKVVKWRVEYKVAWLVIARNLAGKPAAQTAAIHQNMVFRVLLQQRFIYKLHICKHLVLASFARAFAESAVVHQYNVIIVPVKIRCILCPAFDAAGVAVEIEDETFGRFSVEMESVDANTGCNVEEQFLEGDIILKPELAVQLLRLKNKPIL